MNLIEIAGHLGADAETRFTPSGQKVTSLRMATKSRKGNKDETIWWRVTLWGDRFDRILPYLKKGTALIIVGELSKPEIYTDKEGNPQVVLNITAEIIKFSPFGKGERSEQTTTSENTVDEFGAAQAHKGFAGSSVQQGSALNYPASIAEDNVPF